MQGSKRLCPGRGAAFFMPSAEPGPYQTPESVTAPALQRTVEETLRCVRGTHGPAFNPPRIDLTAAPATNSRQFKEPAMSKPSIEQTRMGTEAIAFCIARTLIEREPSLKAPIRANLRKMWELLEDREDHGAADMVDTMIKALNDPAFFKP
jgi:hypothetical protein